MESSLNLNHPDTCDSGNGSWCQFAGLGISKSIFSARVINSWVIEPSSQNPLEEIQSVLDSFNESGKDSETESGWLILLGYELGRAIECKAQNQSDQSRLSALNQPDFPLAVIQRWESSFDGSAAPCEYANKEFSIGSIHSSMGKEKYIESVERVQSYIRAGDIYQANISHQLSGTFSGSARACFEELVGSAQPRAGAMMEFAYLGVQHAVLSISPEIFLEYDPSTNMICSEPMKGTRSLHADEEELRDSIKDRAELDMITDLMRNDLGRVCELGSVRVADNRRIESHRSGVLQAVARVEGQLRKQVDISEIIRGTFPPGSITGTPKVRAMQVIDELEEIPRNPYCGSLLVLDDAGRLKSSVLIRTAHIWGEIDTDASGLIQNGQFIYPVGAGIVADSNPQEEWEETLLKAAVLQDALKLEFD
ncbi:MAG: anthranilate synthase component I family protein [Phycisphaerales bacterium]|nr:anthranilate synthase component I family protein [Phycisphaerales bacterium]